MKKNNVTFKELAEQVGVSFQQVQKYATGENEMSLKMLLETCRFLNCSPADIYPEVEVYEHGLSIPKSQTQPQGEGFSGSVVNNHYYAKPTLAETLRGLFADIKILDTNALGIKLLKIAVFIIAINTFFYIGYRIFGLQYSPLFSGTDYLSQLQSSYFIFTYPIAFVLPLIVRHWSIYAIVLTKFHGFLSIGLTYFQGHFMKFDNEIDPQNMWLIKAAIALVLTFGYAWLINKYLRKDSAKAVK